MKSAILIPIIVILVVVAVVGLIKVTGVNPFQKPSSGGVVEQAITKLLDAKTFKVNGGLTAEIETSAEGLPAEGAGGILPGISSLKTFLNVSSMIDQTKKDVPKTSSRVTIGVDAEGMQITGIVDLLTIDSNVYVKLVSIPPMLLSFVGGADDIKNQWIAIDVEALMEQYSQAGVEEGVQLDEEQVQEQLKNLTKEMKAFLEDKTLFDVQQELGQEEISGITTEHYFVSANKQAIKEFVPEYIEMMKKYVPKEQQAEYEKNVQEMMKDFSANFDESWAALGGVSFDVWVEKRGGRLVRLLWQKDIYSSAVENMPEGIENIAIKGDFIFSDFNEKMEIEAPSDSKSFEEVLSGIMSTFAPGGFAVPALPEMPSGF